MTFPVPGPTTTDLVRAFVEVTYEALKRAETAEAKLASEQERTAKLALDLRSAEDRIARQERTQTDSDRLVKRLRDDGGAVPLRDGPRDHLGPVVRCWCGMTHGSGQVSALNTPKARDRIEKNT